jgi:hypothetical protein
MAMTRRLTSTIGFIGLQATNTIGYYGVVGNRCRTSKLTACRRLLAQPAPPVVPRESAATVLRRLTGIDIERCPQCHQGRLVVIATLPPLRLPGLASETARPP